MKIGKFNSRITCKTDHKKINNLTFAVYGEILGKIIVKPSSLSFRLQNNAETIERTIKLKTDADSSFRILSVKSSIPELTTQVVTVTEGKEYHIKTSLKTDNKRKFLRGDITILTDDKEQSEIKVKVYGRAKRKPGKGKFKKIIGKDAGKIKNTK